METAVLFGERASGFWEDSRMSTQRPYIYLTKLSRTEYLSIWTLDSPINEVVQFGTPKSVKFSVEKFADIGIISKRRLEEAVRTERLLASRILPTAVDRHRRGKTGAQMNQSLLGHTRARGQAFRNCED